MKKLVVLSGVPGSGKSYFSKALKEIKTNHVYIVSSDSLRKEMLGSQRNLSKDETMWKIFFGLVEAYSNDEDGIVILDSTNINSGHRIEIYNRFKNDFDEIYLISFILNKEVVAQQNKEREYPVPDYVLTMFMDKFEAPKEEEYSLFNKIYVVSNEQIDLLINDII